VKVTARVAGWLYTSPGAEPVLSIDLSSDVSFFRAWKREPVYLLSEAPTVELDEIPPVDERRELLSCEDCKADIEDEQADKTQEEFDAVLCEDCAESRRSEIEDCQCPGGEELGPCSCPACLSGGRISDRDPDYERDSEIDDILTGDE